MGIPIHILFFLVHPEEKYMPIEYFLAFFVSDKNYELHLSRRLETAVARRSWNRLINLQ